MMKTITSISLALVGVASFAAGLEPWQDPQVNEINRLPARTLIVPCETEDIAIGVANGEKSKYDSRYVMSLNREWDFKWKPSPEQEWQKEARIAVPGCWQLQGDYDPPLYTNVKYPIGFDTTGNPMIEPPKEYTSYKYRNPVGLYTTSFKRPWRWYFRRTVLRFHGVGSAFRVRVNGKFAGYAEDSRLPSEFDISPYLKWFGANKIEVEVWKHSDGTYLEDQDLWRFSGIFREVLLVSENTGAPRDMVVETWLSDDYSKGRFTIRDENGKELKVRDVEKPHLWNAEFPCVYVTPLEHKWGWWIFGGTDYYAVSLGFRKVEIRDSVLYLNGKRILFKGVNRHEIDPETGYTMTKECMRKDIRIMRDFNINAVRTCHYPDVPEWYDLCDRDGIMVVCEANIESHGAGYGDKTLAKNPAWKKSHVERGSRMVKFFRNHPSILIWSLGNEAGYGDNFTAEFKAIREIDPTRPIHYEGASLSRCKMVVPETEIECPMYAPPAAAEKYVSNSPAKPYILCEYTHAMGNSNGGVMEYWDLTRKYPSFQGGFVWDFADQAIWKKASDGRRSLAYGGDFGDVPNDDNFNCNGLFDALRNPHPGAWELKHIYQPINVTSFDWATGEATIKNENAFVPLDDYDGVAILEKGGEKIASRFIALEGIGAGESKKITVENIGDADSVHFRFNGFGEGVAWNQFTKPFVPTPVPAAPASAAVSDHGLKMNFWRAPTDNDRGWNMPEVCAVWKNATATQKLPEGVKSDLKVYRLEGGDKLVDWTLVVPEGLPPIPRVGLTFQIPLYGNREASWYGLGPWENYSDRATAAVLGVHKATIGLVGGFAGNGGTITYPQSRLNPDNYSEPGEQGYRTGCRWAKFGGAERRALNIPFGFNAWPYTQEMLEAAKHQTDLVETDNLTINVDAVQMGVGGDDSWRSRPHAPYMPGAGTYRLAFIVKGL